MTDRELFEKWAIDCGKVQGWSGELLRAHREAQMICYDEMIQPLTEALQRIYDLEDHPADARQALEAHAKRLKGSDGK